MQGSSDQTVSLARIHACGSKGKGPITSGMTPTPRISPGLIPTAYLCGSKRHRRRLALSTKHRNTRSCLIQLFVLTYCNYTLMARLLRPAFGLPLEQIPEWNRSPWSNKKERFRTPSPTSSQLPASLAASSACLTSLTKLLTSRDGGRRFITRRFWPGGGARYAEARSSSGLQQTIWT